MTPGGKKKSVSFYFNRYFKTMTFIECYAYSLRGTVGGAESPVGHSRSADKLTRAQRKDPEASHPRCGEGRNVGQARSAPGGQRRTESICWRGSEGLHSNRNRNLSQPRGRALEAQGRRMGREGRGIAGEDPDWGGQVPHPGDWPAVTRGSTE